jgi:two-component system, NarL family, sensor kinase
MIFRHEVVGMSNDSVSTAPDRKVAPAHGPWLDGQEPAGELAILSQVAKALNGSVSLHQGLEKTLSLLGEHLDLPAGWVWLLDGDTQRFYLAASRNLPPFLQEPVRMSGVPCLCTSLFREDRLSPSNIAAISCSRLAEGVPETTLGLSSHATIPLYFQDRPLGIMNLTSTGDRRLSSDELRLLATVASQIGTAIERARLAEEATRVARAEERSRIAREIHDTLAQDLTAIGLDLEGALRHLDDSPERARERLERALATARESLEEARRSVLDLRAGPPAARSLTDGINALGRSFMSDTGIHVRFSQEVKAQLPPWAEAELYRVVQEALANVRKHACATNVEIDLRVTPQGMKLTVADNGAGFEPRREPSEGHGLVGMRERAEIIGGRLQVHSRPGHGTKISVRASLPEDDLA